VFAQEIADRLQNQAVGIFGRSIFIGASANFPVGEVCVSVIETGGTGPSRTHNNTATQRPTAQIATRAKGYDVARAKAQAAYEALGGANGLYNITLSSVFYLSVTTRQEPTDAGLDDNARQVFTFNIDAEKQPS
jgi:hypothetical protein